MRFEDEGHCDAGPNCIDDAAGRENHQLARVKVGRRDEQRDLQIGEGGITERLTQTAHDEMVMTQTELRVEAEPLGHQHAQDLDLVAFLKRRRIDHRFRQSHRQAVSPFRNCIVSPPARIQRLIADPGRRRSRSRADSRPHRYWASTAVGSP
jgi:hypothetical protein